jgi:GSCFA family
MPLISIDGNVALDTREANPHSRWPTPGTENRLTPIARPSFHPSFTFARGEKIFTVGSCFARHTEAQLQTLGFDLPTLDFSIPGWPGWPNGFLNKYVPHAILNEFNWALDPDSAFPFADAFLEVEPGLWQDPHGHYPSPAPFAEVIRRREMSLAATRQLAESRILIVTLGLIEAWWDEHLGIYLNTRPPQSWIRRSPTRFRFHLLSYDDVIEALDRIFECLRKHGHPDLRIVLTVSPVPITSTYTENDVLTANMYSKSVLRTAAEEFVRWHTEIDYFPSYESVMLSERSKAWHEDNIHVTRRLVRINVERMIRAYCPTAMSLVDPAATLPLQGGARLIQPK